MARKDEARRWEVKMTISDQELFCDFYLWERIFVDSQINHKFVNPQICERGEIWECSNINTPSIRASITSPMILLPWIKHQYGFITMMNYSAAMGRLKYTAILYMEYTSSVLLSLCLLVKDQWVVCSNDQQWQRA